MGILSGGKDHGGGSIFQLSRERVRAVGIERRVEADVILSAGAFGDGAEQGVVAAWIFAFEIGGADLNAAGQALVVAVGHGQVEPVGAFLQCREMAQVGARSSRVGPHHNRSRCAIGLNHLQVDARRHQRIEPGVGQLGTQLDRAPQRIAILSDQQHSAPRAT